VNPFRWALANLQAGVPKVRPGVKVLFLVTIPEMGELAVRVVKNEE
jgi:hypothetical protein